MGELIPRDCLLSQTYFGPVQWYQKLARHRVSYIEQCDNYVKQTYRNRCVIATANGLQTLTVPVERGDGAKTAGRDVRISDHGSWRHLHWNALASAYGESPFFEFYADDLRLFFQHRWTYLYDFDLAIVEKMCGLLGIHPELRLTTNYRSETSPDPSNSAEDVSDFRIAIRPKRPLSDPAFTPKPYYQVFNYKRSQPFVPNLSILDLLFNEGNEAELYL